MKHWSTSIFAIDPVTGQLTEYGGPVIEAPTALLAHEYCQNNGLGYCNIAGELIVDENRIDYENIQSN